MKKRNKRQWFVPVFQEGLDTLKKEGSFPIRTIAFDSFDNAYSYAASIRLTPIRDENGELVLDENGYAILPSHGKISIMEIDGKKIDWKRVDVISNHLHLMGMGEQRDGIELLYHYPFNKSSIRAIREEPDNFYQASTIKKEEVDSDTSIASA